MGQLSLVARLANCAGMLSTIARLMLADLDELAGTDAQWDELVEVLGLPRGTNSGDVLEELRNLTRYSHGRMPR